MQLYGRKVTEGLRKGTPLDLYLPGPHRGIWNRAALTEHLEVILCESLLDAMTFWVAGYRNVTTAYGRNGFTAELREAVVRCISDRVVSDENRSWRFPEPGSRDALCSLIGTELSLSAVDFEERLRPRTPYERSHVRFDEPLAERSGWRSLEESTRAAKSLNGFKGASVLEIIEDHDGNTYRAVYTVRFAEVVYVLHVFKKKSKKGIQTPKHVMDLIRARLRDAEHEYRKKRRGQ